MPGNRSKPIGLVVANGTHMSKEDIERRKKQEIKAPADNVKPPKFLNPAQKREFKKISNILIDLDIFSNLDCDSLASYIVNRDLWIHYTDEINKAIAKQNESNATLENATRLLNEEIEKEDPSQATIQTLSKIRGEEMDREAVLLDNIEQLSRLQEKSFKQARMTAGDNGLTISSRCKLIVPVSKEPPKENKFSKFVR